MFCMTVIDLQLMHFIVTSLFSTVSYLFICLFYNITGVIAIVLNSLLRKHYKKYIESADVVYKLQFCKIASIFYFNFCHVTVQLKKYLVSSLPVKYTAVPTLRNNAQRAV